MKKAILLLAVFGSAVLNTSAQNYRLWATYYGGNDLDGGYNVTTDAAGNVYLTGQTYSANGIATAESHQSTYGGGGGDAYLVKFNAAGTRLWATYYGGSGSDYGYGVKTDAAGNIYMVGYTSSTDSIATAGSYQPAFSGTTDAYVVKFNSSGVRQWATYYGGADFDLASNLAIDATGNVYVTGYTVSTTVFASAGAHQMTNGGMSDAFLAKFSGTSGARLWSTFYGGSDNDVASDVAVDSAGNVVMAGYTFSLDSIASPGGFQNSLGGGSQDAFVAKFNSAGTRQWATYYGGSAVDYGNAIATGSGGSIYLAGHTMSNSGIASGGFLNTINPGGLNDAYLVKFNAAGNRVWGTYYGGTGTEEGESVATDAWGNVFLGGDTYSPNAGNCIATPNGWDTSLTGSENHFLAAFTSGGLRVCGTYYGNLHEEEGHLTVNSVGDIYMEGWTFSTSGITTVGAHQTAYGGGQWDAFLVKYSTAVPHEEVIVPNDSFPPTPPIVTTSPPKIYVSSIDIFNGGGISISNAVFRNFSPGAPLPAAGSSTISFTCDFTGMYSNGGPPVAIACTAIVKVKVDFSSSSGPTRIYDTEMLQLDLSGGTLPVGLKLRESPTLQSHGKETITAISGGKFLMSSFFDVFTELSTDGGNSWQPAANSPARLDLQDSPSTSIPTLSEWGLIALSVLILFTGIFFVRTKAA